MQILHPFVGSIQQYAAAISDPDRYRPDHCPQCEAQQPLTGHGFYRRTLVDPAFDGVIRVRRYLCRLCKRSASLLPQFALPWRRFSITVIWLFLGACLLRGLTLAAAALTASQAAMPYPRGQFWIRRFRKQAPPLGVALAPLAAAVAAPDFVTRAVGMLESIGWLAAHRFLFSQLRAHLRGWPHFLAPAGQRPTLVAACPATRGRPPSICLEPAGPPALGFGAGEKPMDDAHHHTPTGQPHRTPQARKPAPHRHDPVARTGPVLRPGRAARVGLHALSLSQTARPLGTATAGPPGTQEVRGPTRQPDRAGRHAVRPLGRPPRRRPPAGLPARHPGRRQPPHPPRPVLHQPGTRRRARLPAPGHRRARHTHPPLHR